MNALLNISFVPLKVSCNSGITNDKYGTLVLSKSGTIHSTNLIDLIFLNLSFKVAPSKVSDVSK